MEALREQMARLAALVEAQQAMMESQQSEIAELRSQRSASASIRKARRGITSHTASQMLGQTAGRASSRRALLKWGGAAAAAATVALAAGEQAVHAQPRSDGSNIQAGNTTTAEHATTLNYDGSSGNAKVLFLANDSSYTAGQATYPAALAGWIGSTGTSGNTTGVYGYSEASNGNGVVGYSKSGKGVYAITYDTVNGQSAMSAINYGTAMGVYAETKDATNGSPAIYAVNNGTGDGIDAYAAGDRIGVYGQATSETLTGAGVIGWASQAYGVLAHSSTGIDLYVGGYAGQGRIFQEANTGGGAPISGSYRRGEQIRDILGELWLCVAAGSPGTWVRAAHIPNGYSGGGTAYLSKPIRLLDTRAGDGNAWKNPGSPYAGGSTNTLQVAGVSWQGVDVPSTAVGAIGKVTVISGTGGTGYVALAPAGSGTPTTGTLPYGANATLATSFNVGLGGSPGSLEIYVGGTTINVVIDLFAVVS